MKTYSKLIWILSVLALAGGVSCTRMEENLTPEALSPEQEGDKITFEASFVIPTEPDSPTKSMATSAIQNIYIAVFGSSHYLNQFVQAIPLTSDGKISLDGSNNYKYETWSDDAYHVRFILTESSKVNYVHILANVPSVPDFDYEDVVMGKMLYCSGTDDGYWQYLPLQSGINSSTVSQFDGLKLVRNYAKVRLEVGTGLTLMGYDLFNTPDRGSFAPYTSNDFDFYNGWVNGGAAAAYNDVKAAYNGYLVPGSTLLNDIPEASSFTTNTEDKFVYEHPFDGNLDNSTYILAKIQNGSAGPKFYRLDILNDDESRASLLRNYYYKFKVTSISSGGYDTPAQAALNPSDFNFTLRPESQPIPEIRNNNALMETSYVEKVFTAPKAGEKFQYRYFTDLNDSGTIAPGHVSSISGSGEVQEGWNDGEPGALEDGWYTVYYDVKDPAESLGGASELTSTFTVRAGTGSSMIERKVNIITMKKKDFQNVTASNTEKKVTVSFTLPEGLRESMFPIVLKFWSPGQTISPQGGDLISAYDEETHEIYFRRYIRYDAYEEGSEHPTISLTFAANAIPDNMDLYITDEGDYFNQLTVGVNTFKNVGFSTLALGTGKTAKFHFEYSGESKPITMTFTNLSPVTDGDSRFSGSGPYTFTPSGNGVQSFQVRSTDAFADGKIQMVADGYGTETFTVVRPTNFKVPVGAVAIRRSDGVHAPLNFMAANTLVYVNNNGSSTYEATGSTSTFSKNYYYNEKEIRISKSMFPGWSSTTPVYFWYHYQLGLGLLTTHNYRADTTLGVLLAAEDSDSGRVILPCNEM